MPEWEVLAIQASRGILSRFEKAMNACIRRGGNGETPGFPRFKPISRFRTIEMAGVREDMVKRNADGTRGWLAIKGLPRLRFRIKSPLPKGKLRGILTTRKPTGWCVSLQCAGGSGAVAGAGRRCGRGHGREEAIGSVHR